MNFCMHGIFHRVEHYFTLCNYETIHNVTTDGSCLKSCGSLSTYNAKHNVFVINQEIAADIGICLETCDVTLEYEANINIAGNITWNTNHNLFVKSEHNIIVSNNVHLYNNGRGALQLMAGISGDDPYATVKFETASGVYNSNGGITRIYYNPSQGSEIHKYHNINPYHLYIKPMASLKAYAWVNCAQDLQDISYFLSGNYALSKDIIATSMHNFIPLGNDDVPFSGNFNGNNHGIIGLHINGNDQVGIFGIISGSRVSNAKVHDLWLKDMQVMGIDYVGLLAGEAEYVSFINIEFKGKNQLSATGIAGGLVGSASGIVVSGVEFDKGSIDIKAEEYAGILIGAIRNSSMPICSSKYGDLSYCGFYDND